MKIQREAGDMVEFGNLEEGDVFTYDGDYYLMTDNEMIVNLMNGVTIFVDKCGLESYDRVCRVECTLLVK